MGSLGIPSWSYSRGGQIQNGGVPVQYFDSVMKCLIVPRRGIRMGILGVTEDGDGELEILVDR